MEKYIGMLLDDRYEILEDIGVGGMAVVYKAMDHRLNRLVAVKILKDDYLDDAEFRRRFHVESQAVAMMSHPNIVSVYDVSRNVGIEYIVMELIDGISLKQYMDQRGPLSWRETLHFSMQIAKALEHAHSRNIIHRDIKPHNVMVLKDGSVKVADFGIARITTATNTLTKEALGSVHYISPEQAKGAVVDHRSDIYSLGVVMYEMLTGRPPYDGETPVSVAIQHINGTPLSPSLLNSDIPTGLEQITMHAMCSDLNIRYASVTDMLKDMEEFRKDPTIRFTFRPKGTASSATPVGTQGRSKPQTNATRQKELKLEYQRQDQAEKRRRIWMVAAICLAAVGLFGLLVLTISQTGDKPEQTSESVVATETTVPSEIFVPTFVGSIYDDITPEKRQYLNLIVNESSYVYDETYPAGVVVDQSPQSGEKVPVGTEVFLHISMGPKVGAMPKLSGQSAENATSLLKAMDLKLVILTDNEYSDTVPEGYVTRTDPAEETELKNGQVVNIFISKGKENKLVSVPSVVGASADNANVSIAARKLVVQTEEDYSPTVMKGFVISQSPAAGTEVSEGATVKIVVSKGKQTITLINVVGETENAAKEKLTAAGFPTRTELEYTDLYAAGVVIKQTPEAGAEVMPGSTILLTISNGVKPAPSETVPEPTTGETPQPAPSDGNENP